MRERKASAVSSSTHREVGNFAKTSSFAACRCASIRRRPPLDANGNSGDGHVAAIIGGESLHA